MTKALRCLVVGLPEAGFAEGSALAEEAAQIDFAQLPSFIPVPDTVELVVSPLFCPDFDALELLEILGKSGFRKSVRVVAPKLPNRQVVLRELRSHAVRQGITIEIVEITD